MYTWKIHHQFLSSIKKRCTQKKICSFFLPRGVVLLYWLPVLCDVAITGIRALLRVLYAQGLNCRGGIPADLRSGTSYSRSTTSNNGSCTSQLRSGTFLLGSTTLLGRIQASYTIVWRRGVVDSGVRRMNEVNARRARLLPGWVTVFGRIYHLGM